MGAKLPPSLAADWADAGKLPCIAQPTDMNAKLRGGAGASHWPKFTLCYFI